MANFTLKKLKSFTETGGTSAYIETSGLKLLGKGRTRLVYGVGSKVLKLARNPDGYTGNRIEASASGSKFAPTVADAAKDFQWILVEKVALVTEATVDGIIRSRTGVPYWDFLGALWVGSKGLVKSHSKPVAKIWKLRELHQSLMENPWYKEFFKILVEYQLDPFELHAVNLGLSKGNLVVTDIGPSFG